MEAHGLGREAGQPRGGALGLNFVYNDPEPQIHQLPSFPLPVSSTLETSFEVTWKYLNLPSKFCLVSVSLKVFPTKVNSKYR